MTSEMTLLRKEDLSLYYYIKDTLLCDFIEYEENATLTYMEPISTATSKVYEVCSTVEPSPIDRGRGWVYFDAVSSPGSTGPCRGGMSTTEQSNRVVVYNATGGIIPEDEYIVDYIDGRIITSGTTISGTPAAVDYYWNYVSIVDEWSAIEAADTPVVVLDISGTDKDGYQLGGGRKVMRKVDIHIFGSDTAERNDLVDKLFDGFYLKSSPLYDFPEGGVLDHDGTFYYRKNLLDKDLNLFDNTTVSGIIGNMEFHKVTSRHVNLPLIMTRGRGEVMLSDLNAYRSKISFDSVYYTTM